jgi:uncharacterized protein YndB with AHSA1/START domain
MKKLTFSTQIAAPRTRVWSALWDDSTYRQWTSLFTEGSHAISDWREGSRILFLGPAGDGMASRIDRLIPGEFMSFEHLGEVKGGVEVTGQQWAGARENYTLRDHDGGTEVTVELDTVADFAGYLAGVFPKALARLKELAEAPE